MDISIRKNDHCIIGLPRCDFVFSSTRTCFIAYGFKTSPMEMTILRNILEKNGIQCEEAGGKLAPGQNAFCKKICSKIITSQFCIVLLNHDEKDGQIIPNANVNMEYGLMLGFNKFIIPFQNDKYTLPFNVAALDTLKYTGENLEAKASSAIKEAIESTTQNKQSHQPLDKVIDIFLLSKKLIMVDINDSGEKSIYRFGSPFGFYLLHDFSGMIYHFFGNFTSLRPENIIWRLTMINDLLNERKGSMEKRLELGIIKQEKMKLAEALFSYINFLILVTSDEEKKTIQTAMDKAKFRYPLEIYSITDMNNDIDKL
jgi:hypothetical protein